MWIDRSRCAARSGEAFGAADVVIVVGLLELESELGQALPVWETRLDALDITHRGIVDAHYGSGLSFRDPDGIPLEFFTPLAAPSPA